MRGDGSAASWLTRMRRYVRDALRGRRLAKEIDEELQFHLDALVDELTDRGVPLDEARRVAGRRFGRLDVVRDKARHVRGVGLVDSLREDVRLGVRRLRCERGFAAAVILVFADALRPVSVGLIAGLCAGAWLVRFIEASLYHVSPHDPLTLFLVTVVFISVAAAAVYGPARRAIRIDPATALRTE